MIWTSYPRYHGYVIRPPSEANSLILQVMYGCSHGDCTFCGSYLGKPFRVRPFDEVIEDVQNLPEGYKRNIDRVFLADGDALAIPKRRMLELLELLKAELPSLERISAYANAHSLLRLSQEDLDEIRQHGLELLYLGLESGDDPTLEWIKKGVTVAQQIEGCHKAKAAGFAMSVTAILGIGGEERTHEHAIGTGKALSAIDPEYIGILSLMLESGTEMTEAVRSGSFVGAQAARPAARTTRDHRQHRRQPRRVPQQPRLELPGAARHPPRGQGRPPGRPGPGHRAGKPGAAQAGELAGAVGTRVRPRSSPPR